MRVMLRYGLAVFGVAVVVSVLPAPRLVSSARAQDANAQPSQSADGTDTQLTPAALQQLVGRVALYPDDLLSIVLPASTQPLQLVEAQRFLDRRKTDKSLKPPTTWDPSVVALLNYPDVVSMMNSDLDWTQQLGNAVIAQQTDVLDAIQAFRKQVYDAGNLKSNDKQSVKVENQTVVVQSADPQTIYVPQYNPQVVVAPVAVGAPAPYYYSPPYPYYASPAATFATGAVFGTAVGFAIGWSSHGIYSGDWGRGGYYGDGNVNINRSNNININNTRLTDAQRTQFNNRVTQNRENAWHPDRNAAARQQASLRTHGQAGRVNSSDIRSGLAHGPGAAGARVSPQARQNIQHGLANRGGGAPGHQPGTALSNRAPGSHAGNRQALSGQHFNQGGGHPALRQSATRPAVHQPGGAFAGYHNGGAANRFSNRGGASLRSSNRFQGGGGQFHGGGGFHGGRGGGRGFHR